MTSPMDEMILRSAIKNLEFDRDAALKRAEAAEARAKKAEAALLRWDAQAIGDALGLPIGADVPDRAVGAIKDLRKRIEKAEAEVAKLKASLERADDGLSVALGLKGMKQKALEAAEAEVARLKGLLERAATYIDQTGLGAAIYEAVKREAGAKPPEPWARTVPATNHPAGDVVKPPEPYTPRVGDVVLFDGERAESAEATPRVVTSVEPDGWWSCVHLNRRRDAVTCGPFRISGRIGEARLHRPATPAERAAAGLPVEPDKPVGPRVLSGPYWEADWSKINDGDTVIAGGRKITMRVEPFRADPHPAPAQPQVLPEHLAWMEADAAWACSSWSTDFDATKNKKRYDEAILAARALVAAVARRDGGAK